MDGKMIVRKATIKDIENCSKILLEAYYDNVAEAKKYLLVKLKQGTLYILSINREIAGLMSYDKDYSHSANYLSNIAVARKFRGKGVAKRLINEYIKISKRITPKDQKYALSSTDVTNMTSIKMHLKCGFKKIGIIKGLHYGKDEIFFGIKLR